MFLVKQFYPKVNIKYLVKPTMVNKEKARSFYHRLSHLFIGENTAHRLPSFDFYNVVWYGDPKDKRLKRLQIRNPGRTGGLLPLFRIDEAYDIKESCKKLLGEGFKNFNENIRKVVQNFCADMTILGFLLFCYSLRDYELVFKDKNDSEIIERLKAYIDQLSTYAYGLQQLIENIVHHTERGQGCLIFRPYKKGTIDNKLIKYWVSPLESPYLEVCIADYSGTEKNGNLAAFRAIVWISRIMELQRMGRSDRNKETREFFEHNYFSSCGIILKRSKIPYIF